MNSNQNVPRPSSTSSEQLFREQMQRMFSVWTLSDKEIRAGKAAEYRLIFDRVGIQRFTAAVGSSIQYHATGFFPTPGEFDSYIPTLPIPQVNWQHSMSEILEKQKEWDEPETQAILQNMDRMIKGGFKSMNRELGRPEPKREGK